MLIDNPSSQRVRKLVSLARRSFRIKHGLLLVEGPQAVLEACRYAAPELRDVYYLSPGPDTVLKPEISEILDLARQATRWVHPVTEAVVKAVAPASQGIFATVKLFPAQTTIPETALKNPSDLLFLPRHFSMLLPEIKDPGNLGTLLRIADAFDAQQVFTCKNSCDVNSPKVIRASAGSFFHLPIYANQNLDEFAALAKKGGAVLVGADAHQAQAVDEFLDSKPVQHLILTFGNEAHGFSTAQRKLLDYRVKIPLSGKAESLNVSAAAAVICHEVSRYQGPHTW